MNVKMHIWDIHCSVIYNTEKLQLNQVEQVWGHQGTHIRGVGAKARLWVAQADRERLSQYRQGKKDSQS